MYGRKVCLATDRDWLRLADHLQAMLGNPLLVADKTVVIDMVYVENVVHAFFCLENSLSPGSVACGQVCAMCDLE
jgi:hypothetical protein